MKAKINGQQYNFNEDGSWEHLGADISKSETPFKKDGALKAKYKDLPRYKIITVYEEHFQKEFRKTLLDISKNLFADLKKKI
tara:strand:+ start:9574 stop:9819 length:246 start_codon:yes stop_codon:yes gene_type:complete